MTGGKVTVEFENGATQTFAFKSLHVNLEQDIDLNPDENDPNVQKSGDHAYKLGSKYAVLYGFLADKE
jgi:hypothetical protein